MQERRYTATKSVSTFGAEPAQQEHKAEIIDGKAIAAAIRGELAEEVQRLEKQFGKVPTWANHPPTLTLQDSSGPVCSI